MLEYIELCKTETPRAIMLWLHGLGADAYDLEPLAEMLPVSGIRHVLPNAPVRPITINNGMGMRAWYDIAAPDLRWQEDEAGMRTSTDQVRELIRALRSDSMLPVILAGFSQGAVISLSTAVGGVAGLTGVAAMSGYVPQSQLAELHALNGLPIFMAHGEQDNIIPHTLARQGSQDILAAGAKLEWHSYPMPHAICTEEIQALAAWVKARLAEKCPA